MSTTKASPARPFAPLREPATGRGPAPGEVFRALGTRPVINCAGVRTDYGGSNPSDDVLAAMTSAAGAFVPLDELARGIGQRLAELTGAEWGVVTAGTAATLALTAAACIAGNDPEAVLRLPDTGALANRVLVPADHRFAYEQGLRLAGAEIVCAEDLDGLEDSLDGSVVLICLLGRVDARARTPLPLVAEIARRRGVPVLVDAAGLSPSNPDRWLVQGADLVVYSGGKYLRAPQSTAILIGRQDLCEAVWLMSAPHQSFGRAMKVGKEEMVGAVAAIERWITAPAARAEIAAWKPRLDVIERAVTAIPGVATELFSSPGSVTAVRLRVRWDQSLIAFTAEELRRFLLDQDPRILIHDFWSTENSVLLDPVNISDAETEVVAETLSHLLRNPGRVAKPAVRAPASVDVSGQWDLSVSFLIRSAAQVFRLTQSGEDVTGVHLTEHSQGSVSGYVSANTVVLEAVHQATPLVRYYRFEGTYNSGTLKGAVSLGAATPEHRGPVFCRQFGTASWTARLQRAEV